jgi:ATP:ADP antiporter, AAA family
MGRVADTDPARGPAAPRGPLEKLLRVFGDVRAGEGGTALLMLLSLFVLLLGYYILKTLREPLILASGAEMKSYASALQAVTLMGFVPAYGWLASRVGRQRLVTWVVVFFIVNIELFALGLWVGTPYLGIIFYVWVGIFSLASIAQFWSFANDLYRTEEGKRLFPLIGLGATGGSWAGSRVAELLFERDVPKTTLLQVTVALLVVHLVLYLVIGQREARRRSSSAAAEPPPLGGPGGFTLVLSSPYLRIIGVLFILLNIVNTTGEYVISRSVVHAAEAAVAQNPGMDKDAFIGAFYGNYYFWGSFVAVILQALVVSRIVRYAGIAGVLLLPPLLSLGGYSIIGLGAGFGLIRMAKIAENASDYSIMNTARQMLWLPTRREEKYKAKQTLDTFFVRAGDVLSAGIVFAGTAWLGLGVAGFARANVALVLVWLGVAWLLVRENRALTARVERADAA